MVPVPGADAESTPLLHAGEMLLCLLHLRIDVVQPFLNPVQLLPLGLQVLQGFAAHSLALGGVGKNKRGGEEKKAQMKETERQHTIKIWDTRIGEYLGTAVPVGFCFICMHDTMYNISNRIRHLHTYQRYPSSLFRCRYSTGTGIGTEQVLVRYLPLFNIKIDV